MDNLVFQVIDIGSDDVPIGDSFWDREFKVTFYGKTIEGKNVVCNVCGFKPFFYIRVVKGWAEAYTKGFLTKVKQFVSLYKSGARNTWKGHYVSLERERFNNRTMSSSTFLFF